MSFQAPLLIIATLCLTAHAIAQDGIYKWTVDGKTVYSDKPPPEGVESAAPITIEKNATSTDPGLRNRRQRRERLLNAFEIERTQQAEASAKAEQAQAKREADCERARRALATYESSGLLYNKSEDDERIYLSDEQREAELAKARAFIKHRC